MFAAHLSHLKGTLSKEEQQRIVTLLSNLGLPTAASFDREQAFRYMLKDKKKEQATIHFITMNSIGRADVTPLSTSELQQYYKKMEAFL